MDTQEVFDQFEEQWKKYVEKWPESSKLRLFAQSWWFMALEWAEEGKRDENCGVSS